MAKEIKQKPDERIEKHREMTGIEKPNGKSKMWIYVIIGVVILGLIITGYFMFFSEVDVDEKYTGPVENAKVQLKWIHQAQFAGFYAAEQKGFYEDEKIDVELIPGGGEITPEKAVDELLEGKSDFAIISGSDVLKAVDDNKDIVAISVIFQGNPQAYAVLKESGIEHPVDFKGKKLMLPSDGIVQHNALMRKLEIDTSTIELVEYAHDITPLVTGEIDIHQIYSISLGVLLKRGGYDVKFMFFDDYDIKFYGDTIITRKEMIENNPKLVERFLRATLNGWRYSLENPSEAVEMIAQYDSNIDRDYQLGMLEAETPLILTGEHEIGYMDKEIWQEMYDILSEQGILEKQTNIDNVFTMEFLD